MSNIHILNGDALNQKIPNSVPGERIIFRECFADGPVDFDSFEELIVGRTKYLNHEYPGTLEKPYEEDVAPQLEDIFTISDSTDVFCWFEADLFCQVNFWYTINALSHHSGKVALILPKDLSLYFGFSSLDESELLEAFREPFWFSKNHRGVLKTLWHLYQKEKVDEAFTLAERVDEELPFLIPALQAWKEAIPKGDFPGKPKQVLREIAQELTTDKFELIYREFHKRLPIYGYGDLMVYRLWKELEKENRS